MTIQRNINLELLKQNFLFQFHQEFAEDLDISVSCKIEDTFAYHMIKTFRAQYKIRSTTAVRIQWYPTWWEHFKDSVMPAWFKKRFPIKISSRTINLFTKLPAACAEADSKMLFFN